ncbi:MAG: 50S ribosomal protein L13 [Planctomycetes bacterium]|nr:50S ribosomal protein L13 [Planctomycetota bacterium]
MERQTYFAKPGEVEQRWLMVDAEGKVLGRLAAKLATILQGKNKPQYTAHCDVGDFVVVLNAEKIVLTGRKAEQNFHQTYSRYPGGQKSMSFGEMRTKHPERLLELAVRRMLPKGHMGVKMLTKLKIYAGTDHPHQAQAPQAVEL